MLRRATDLPPEMVTSLWYQLPQSNSRRRGFRGHRIIAQVLTPASKLDNWARQRSDDRCSGKLSIPGGTHPIDTQNEIKG
jgi:hypothetical protein